MNTLCRNVIKTLLLVLLAHSNFCFASHAQASHQQSSLEDFLCHYFEIPPIFKNLPKNVQHIIVRHWINRYIVPFVLTDPYARYNCAKKSSREGPFREGDAEFDSIDSLAFSADDSELAIVAKHVHILPVVHESHDVPLWEAAQKFCKAFIDSTLTPDFSCYMTIQGDAQNERGDYDDELQKLVGPYLEVYHIKGPLAGTKERKYFRKMLKDESIGQIMPKAMLDGEMASLTDNRVRGIGFSHTGEWVIPTAHKCVYLLKADGSATKLLGSDHPFNPYDIEPHLPGTIGRKRRRYYSFGWQDPKFAQQTPVFAVECEGGITLCNYEKRTFVRIKERNEFREYFIKGLSPHAEWMLLRNIPGEMYELINTHNFSSHEVIIPGGRSYDLGESVCFSPDGLFLILANRLGEIYLYHTPTCQIIGIIDHGVSLISEKKVAIDVYTAFNHAGSVFATSTIKSTLKTRAHLLSLWRVDPRWKQLDSLYKGHITLEQALLLMFLGHKRLSKKTLEVLAHEKGISRESLVACLKRVRDSFTIDPAALRWYLRYVLLQEQPVKY